MSYTKSPWKISHTAYYAWVHNDNEVIAKIVNKNDYDAALIVSAPKLLKALQHIISLTELPVDVSLSRSEVDKYRKLISEALGEKL